MSPLLVILLFTASVENGRVHRVFHIANCTGSLKLYNLITKNSNFPSPLYT